MLCWRRLESPLDCKEIKSVNPKEVNLEYSLKGLMLKLKLQCFGHLMQGTDSLEKTLMLGNIESKNRRGQQRMRWLDSISDFVDMNLSKLQEIMKDSEFWNTALREATNCRTQLSDWTPTIISSDGVRQLDLDLNDSKKIFVQLYSLVTCGVLNGPLIIIFTFWQEKSKHHKYNSFGIFLGSCIIKQLLVFPNH